jgi:predicted Zn finger-like uncharacterized protein
VGSLKIMDVRCTRCGTEYEFDDALISERGTSVRCTQCGFQFRVFPPQAKVVGPDEWVVLTSLGRRIVYRSLRELQNGISHGEVAREDLLARGSTPPRPLGAIAELDPLFTSRAAPERKSNTLTGVAPPQKAASPKSVPPTDETPRDEEAGHFAKQHDTWSGVAPQAKVRTLDDQATKPPSPMRVGRSTVLGIGVSNLQPQSTTVPRVPAEPPQNVDDVVHSNERAPLDKTESVADQAASEEAPSAREIAPNALRPETVEEAPSAREIAPSALRPETVEEAPSAREIAPNALRPETVEEAPSAHEIAPSAREIAPSAREIAPSACEIASSPSKDAVKTVTVASEPSTAPLEETRRGATHSRFGWLLLGVAVLLGAGYVGIRLIGSKLDGQTRRVVPPTSQPQSSRSAIATERDAMVASSWSAIADALEAGDSVTATRLLEAVADDARSTVDYLRLRVLADAMSIDLLWWQKRLLSSSETGEAAMLESTLSERLSGLQRHLETCRQTEDCKAQTLSAYWALYRMRGQPELAHPPTQGTVDATGLYQLAMLEWVKVGTPEAKTVERLTKARNVGVEQGPRITAYIVALIDTKRFNDARAELANLAAAPQAHPHLEALNRYLRQNESAVTSDGGVPTDGEDIDQALKEPDFRIRLQLATAALSRNEVTKAQKLFRSVVAQRPNDTEALTGLGDVLRRRGDLTRAREQYDRVLSLNSGYLPAMVGSADVRWRLGDKAGASAIYRRIVERVGDGPGYGQQAAARIKEFEGGGAASGSNGDSTKNNERNVKEPATPVTPESRNAP